MTVFVIQRLYCLHVLILFILTVIAVSPWLSFDPFSPIRMIFLSSLSSYFFFTIYKNRHIYGSTRYRFIKYWSISWVLITVLVLMFSQTNLILQAYGTYGRNIGLITIVSLVIILVGFSVTSETSNVNQILLALITIGGGTILYGFFQSLNVDPLQISKGETPASSFFGNVNFYSAIIGTCSLALLGFLKEIVKNTFLISISLIYLLSVVFAIIQSQSQQGFYVLLIGSGTFVLLALFKKYRFSMRFTLPLISIAISSCAAIAGFFQKGPLVNLFYQDTITYRGDYWRAGLKIVSDHPLLGIGFDSFGEYYFRYRDLISSTRGPLVSTNSAHNYFIDYAAESGLISFTLYLAIIAFTILSYIKVFKREKVLNLKITALIAVWIGFQAQAMISPRQISLLVIGWTTSGLIIGYELNSRDENEFKDNQTGSKVQELKITKSSGVISIMLGAVICLPHFTADMQAKSAINSLSLEKIYASAFRKPQDPNRMVSLANNLQAQGFNQEAIEILKQVVVISPDNFNAWKLFSLISTATAEQKSLAVRNMKRLDPNNPDL